MNKIKSVLSIAVITLILSGENLAQVTKDDYKVINYSTAIEEGKPLEKKLLLKSEKNIIANVTLRNGKSLGMHTEKIAFWVLGTAGRGELILGDNEKVIELKQGVMVLVKPGIAHDVIAKDDLSILVIKFPDRKARM